MTIRVPIRWGLALLSVHAVLAPLLILLRTFGSNDLRHYAARLFDALYFFVANPMNSHRRQELFLSPIVEWFYETFGLGFLGSIAAGEVVIALILGGVVYFLVGCLFGAFWVKLRRRQQLTTI